jgi:catechol 2,3-dioxygenase-like lactoylglutathione lyase family enzyme
VTDPSLEFAPLAVELFVPDVAEAVGFYTGNLGFRLVRCEPGPGTALTFAVTALGPAVFMFMDERFLTGKHSPGGPMGEGIDIRLMVDDVDAVYLQCREAGMTLLNPIGDRDYGLRDFIVRDPWGFRLRFASPLR